MNNQNFKFADEFDFKSFDEFLNHISDKTEEDPFIFSVPGDVILSSGTTYIVPSEFKPKNVYIWPNPNKDVFYYKEDNQSYPAKHNEYTLENQVYNIYFE